MNTYELFHFWKNILELLFNFNYVVIICLGHKINYPEVEGLGLLHFVTADCH